MGSVQEYVKCKHCGGVASKDYYYKSGEEVSFCYRCSSMRSLLLKEDEVEGSIENNEDEYPFELKDEIGYGHAVISFEKMNQVISFREPVTDKDVEKFKKVLEKEHVIIKDSYLAAFKDGKLEILVGDKKSVQPESRLDFVDF